MAIGEIDQNRLVHRLKILCTLIGPSRKGLNVRNYLFSFWLERKYEIGMA